MNRRIDEWTETLFNNADTSVRSKHQQPCGPPNAFVTCWNELVFIILGRPGGRLQLFEPALREISRQLTCVRGDGTQYCSQNKPNNKELDEAHWYGKESMKFLCKFVKKMFSVFIWTIIYFMYHYFYAFVCLFVYNNNNCCCCCCCCCCCQQRLLPP